VSAVDQKDCSRRPELRYRSFVCRVPLLFSARLGRHVQQSGDRHGQKELPSVHKKGKVFQYSLPSVGLGVDPGVQAVSSQVTLSHLPGGRMPLHSARPAVTFVAFTRWRHPYTIAHILFQLTILIYRPRKDERLSWPGWLTLQRTVYPQFVGKPSAAAWATIVVTHQLQV